jgi:glycosyltransferase involved in cell wall biosynthesis
VGPSKARLRRALHGPGGGVLRLGHRAAVAGEVAALSVAARLSAPASDPAERAETARRVTVAVKTFERPSVIRRHLRSLRGVFDGRVVVADDSRTPLTWDDPLVDVIPLAFNSGVSVGRNAALAAVTTDYVLVTDDDIVFTAGTDLQRARRVLDDHPEVDVVGFLRIDLPEWSAYDHGPDALFAGHDEPLRPWGEMVGGLPVRYKIAQVFLGRTEPVRAVGWDENLRMVDHKDFFSRACGHLLVVQDAAVQVLHARAPFSTRYAPHRNDTAADLAYLQRVWGQRARDQRRNDA